MIPSDMIKTINDTAHDQRIASRDTSNEAQTDSETNHTSVLTVGAHLAVLALEIDALVGTMNIHALAYPYVTCHVLDLAAHSIHLQIANVLHHWNNQDKLNESVVLEPTYFCNLTVVLKSSHGLTQE